MKTTSVVNKRKLTPDLARGFMSILFVFILAPYAGGFGGQIS